MKMESARHLKEKKVTARPRHGKDGLPQRARIHPTEDNAGGHEKTDLQTPTAAIDVKVAAISKFPVRLSIRPPALIPAGQFTNAGTLAAPS